MAEPAMREAYGDALLKMGEDERVGIFRILPSCHRLFLL